MKKILLILGHPNKDTYCGALLRQYKRGAMSSGAEVRELIIADLKFDPILYRGYLEVQELEPDLVEAQKLICWADHLVFVYPLWWSTMPAILKGFIDRVFLPGFAFKYRENSQLWDRLLKGKSARVVITMDAPTPYNYWINGNAGIKTMKTGILGFCGFKPVRITTIGGIEHADESKLEKWLAKLERLGAKQT